MFLAQVAHESGGFKWNKELGGRDYFQMYEGRKDLGNTEEGDGYRFRGRGFIQLTGRYNYKKFSEDFDKDFVENPDLVAEPPYCVLVAGWYWNKHDLNEYADRQDIEGCTKVINGGYRGLDDRKRWFKKIWDILYTW